MHSASSRQQQQDTPFPDALYDNNTSPVMFSHPAHSTNPYHHFHLFPSNPYPPPPPPPIAHKVWILDCKSCGTFLTNRGMKAVLLLRPNVSLYSSDALPVNCSAHSLDSNVLRPRSACRPNSPPAPARTCECLTQTLCCHGCGSVVGYMIVVPCARCTSSITTTNRATNGHRFVFHSSEIEGTERHYIHDEPGVIPYEPPDLLASLTPVFPSHHSLVYPSPYISTPRDSPMLMRPQSPMSYTRSSSPAVHSEYSSTPPLEYANQMITATPNLASHESYLPLNHTNSLLYQTFPQIVHGQHYQRAVLPHSSPSPPLSPPDSAIHPPMSPSSQHSTRSRDDTTSPLDVQDLSALPQDRKEQPVQLRLKEGSILFWHHLARSGEIPGVKDDERARGSIIAPESPEVKPINISFGR